jgi:hypothetical protein
MPTTEELSAKLAQQQLDLDRAITDLGGSITRLRKERDALQEANVLLVVTLQKIKERALAMVDVAELDALIDSAIEQAEKHVEEATKE